MPLVAPTSYIVRRRFAHDGTNYVPGAVVTVANASTKLGKSLSRLVSAGYLSINPDTWSRRRAMEGTVVRHPAPVYLPGKYFQELALPEQERFLAPNPMVSAHRTVNEVLEDVGNDPDLAAVALEEEQSSTKPRSTLIKALEDIVGPDGQEEPAE